MTFFGKLGHAARYIGSKIAGPVSYLGHKVGTALLTAAPAAAFINPALGAGFAGAGAIAQGIGAIGDVGKSLLSGNAGKTELDRGKAGVGQIKGGVAGLRSAYKSYKSKSGLEKG
jgi:hypothetical protein